MTVYVVRAKPWEAGWELHVDGIGVTQTPALATAERQARDYIETVTGVDLSEDDAVTIVPTGPDDGHRHDL